MLFVCFSNFSTNSLWFPHSHARKIKKKREELEYSINHPSRELKDYVAYIKYERSLITLTKERSRIAKNSQNHTIVPSIAKRMKYIYTEAISRFPQSIRFWDEFVKFLQLSRFTTDVSPAYDRMLQVNVARICHYQKSTSMGSSPSIFHDQNSPFKHSAPFSFTATTSTHGFEPFSGSTTRTTTTTGSRAFCYAPNSITQSPRNSTRPCSKSSWRTSERPNRSWP